MVNHLKTKKYHNSTQNCPFSMFVGPKWQKVCGDSFPDVKRPTFVYIWCLLTIVWFFDIRKCFFSKVKSRISLGVPTESRPTPGSWQGIIGYPMVPKGTLWYHMVPYGTICYHMVPYGTIWYHKVPYGTIRYHMVPCGTIRYLSLIHIWRCRRYSLCRSRWSPYH